jgi:hypothetical protein
MRLSLVISVLLCALLGAAPGAYAKPSVKTDRYLAWFEASATQDLRTSGLTTQDTCSGVYTIGRTWTLSLQSALPSVLVATRRGRTATSFGGTLSGLGGSFREIMTSHFPCPPTLPPGAVPLRFHAGATASPLSGLPQLAPLDLIDGSLAVRADPDSPVAFSAFRYTIARQQCCDVVTAPLAAELMNATASLTPSQLNAAKVDDVVVTGSFSGDVPAAGLNTTRSLTVSWRLTIRAIFDKNATRIE